MRELSMMPLTMGGGELEALLLPPVEPTDEINKETAEKKTPMQLAPTAPGKLRAIIELKAHRVRKKQRALRAQVVEHLQYGTLLPLDHKDFCCRVRRTTGRDAHMTEHLERKQCAERERRAKQRHLERLNSICMHGKEMVAANCAHQDWALKLGRAAYMKLIDTAKDTRITHPLHQTDSYSDSLTQAVVAQQIDDVHKDTRYIGDETAFGAHSWKKQRTRRAGSITIGLRIGSKRRSISNCRFWWAELSRSTN